MVLRAKQSGCGQIKEGKKGYVEGEMAETNRGDALAIVGEDPII